MTLQQLRYIVAIDRHRNFAKAADACQISQPTLSAMLQKLEEDCRRLESISAELDKLREELQKKSEEGHKALNTLKSRTLTVKKAVKSKYDQTWWIKFGIPDKR